MGSLMLRLRLSKNMVGKCMHVSGGAGEAAAIWKCQSYGSGSRGGGGIPEADSDADGVGAVAQGNCMESSNSQSFGGGKLPTQIENPPVFYLTSRLESQGRVFYLDKGK